MVINIHFQGMPTGNRYVVRQHSHGSSPKQKDFIRDWEECDALLNKLSGGKHQSHQVIQVLSIKYSFTPPSGAEEVIVTLS